MKSTGTIYRNLCRFLGLGLNEPTVQQRLSASTEKFSRVKTTRISDYKRNEKRQNDATKYTD